MKIPKGTQNIIKTLKEAGFEAYAVGGCVRDSILGKEPSDWDITTNAKPGEVKSLFRKTFDTGIEHGTVTVLLDGGTYEVTTYRTEGKYSDSRHPDSVTFVSSLEEDLKRRDFTINAMAYNDTDGLKDPFNGREDLKEGIIRAVGDPVERFKEDPLRMMRAVRFSAQRGFVIEGKTRRAIGELSDELSKISAERIREELMKILTSDNPDKIRDLYELGLTRVFLPEFDVMMDTPQNNPHHIYTVGEHTIKAVCSIKNDRILRLAMLLHDVAKPVVRTTDEKGIDHFKGHEEEGAKMSGRILRRLKFDNDTIKRVTNYVRWHDARPAENETSMRKLVAKAGYEAFPGLFLIKRADYDAQSEFDKRRKLHKLEAYEDIYEKIIREHQCVCIKNLAISGGDLKNSGIAQGPQIGEILNKLLKHVIEHPKDNDRKKLMDYVNKNLKSLLLMLCLVLSLASCTFALSACGSGGDNSSAKISGDLWNSGDESGDKEPSGQYILMAIDEEGSTMRFFNTDLMRMQSYSFNSGTVFYDSYGNVSTKTKFAPGDAVKIAVSSGTASLISVMRDADCFEMTDISKYDINADEPSLRYVTIGSSKYRLADSCMVFAQDQEIELSEIDASDVISLRGYDRVIYAIVVETGHGLVSFTGTQDYEGGYVVIGNALSAKVSEGLTLSVREGSYVIYAANSGKGGSARIDVATGQETVVDLSSLDAAGTDKYCEVTFSLTPEDTQLKINGTPTDTGQVQQLKYGTYVLQMTAPGYDTVTRVLMVNSEKAVIALDVASMAQEDAATSSSDSADVDDSDTSSSSSSSGTTSSLANYNSLFNSDDDDDSSSSSLSSLVDDVLGTDTSGITDTVISLITGSD